MPVGSVYLTDSPCCSYILIFKEALKRIIKVFKNIAAIGNRWINLLQYDFFKSPKLLI